ncbi:MAG: M48 family metallopeptidase [Bacteroides sp.]|nr:M48 family metallopeptidase [Bacteroides sp.]
MIYIIGCCCFVLVALASLCFGYYVIRYHDSHELPAQLTIISLAGGLLLWEIIKSFRFKTSLPETFRPVTEHEYPALFDLINEVTTTLNLSYVRKVYICPDATAAVFIQPQLSNILFEPRRNLVVGLGFLTQMDDDEIRAMLYHEFGHYVQKEMKNSISVYTISQFSRSFVYIKELKKQGTWEMQMKLQLLLFTCFTIWICNRINKSYSQLARQMEYDADNVAVKYVGVPTLQRALLHAACIRYNYEVVQWGMQQLQSRNIQVDNPYLALSFVGNYSRPARRLLSDEVVKRVERLGDLKEDKSGAPRTVRHSALLMAETNGQSRQICSALQFAQWLRQGFAIYTRQRLMETSVELEIYLDKRKHKLPYFDGSYKLLLDDKEIGIGNFIKGYTLKRKTSPGRHKLTAYAPSGIISTPFEFEVGQGRAYRIEMDYKLHVKDSVYDVFGVKLIDSSR